MGTIILLLALGSGRDPVEPVDHLVEIVDDNRVFDGEGRETLRQLVYLDVIEGQPRIVAWRLWKTGSMVPAGRGEFKSAVWIDGEIMRRVRCRSVVRSWYQHDYEVESREKHPTDQRRELGGRP